MYMLNVNDLGADLPMTAKHLLKATHCLPVNIEGGVLLWEALLEVCDVMCSDCDTQVKQEWFWRLRLLPEFGLNFPLFFF